MEICTNRHQYINTFFLRATSHPYLSQDDALALKSFSKKVYHELYACFVKQEAGNYSVEHSSYGAVLVIIHDTSPESVRCIESVKRCTYSVLHCFEDQYIYGDLLWIPGERDLGGG